MEKVTSKDGTQIAFDRTGQGPALILVTGAFGTRSDATSLAGKLAPYFTVFAYDRRGRGDSGDTSPYAVEREIEDIEALIEKAAGPGFLYGHSSGAILALNAAQALGSSVKKLAVYEPPFLVDNSRPPIPENYVTVLKDFISTGHRGDAVKYWMSTVIGIPAEAITQMEKSPSWSGMEAVAPTLVYDGTISAEYVRGKPLPANEWSAVTIPTLVMDGGDSPQMMHSAAEALTALLPDARHRRFPGQTHGVDDEVLVPVLVEFYKGEQTW